MKPIGCINESPGWRLHSCHLRAEPGRHDGVLRLAIGGTLATFHGRFADRKLLEDRVVWCVRELLALAGIDPHRRPPASEILLTCFQPAEVTESVAARVHLARLAVMTWAFRFIGERVAPAGR
jgi:hypothetical protein